MALFKIEKGLKDNLALNRPITQEGWCYFTIDDGKFYIDIESEKEVNTNPESRICLNAARADYVISHEQNNEFIDSSIVLNNNVVNIEQLNTIDMTKVESTEGINISVNENQNAFVITNESSNINSEFAHNKIHIDQTTIKNDNIIIQQNNNMSKITNNNISVENNQSKISLEPGKINIDNNGDTSNIIGSQFSGNAASADKLNTDAGSALHPIYFKNGIPVETTYNLNVAGAELGLVKSGGNVTISNGIINVNDDEHNHIIDNIDGLQEALDNKMDKDIGIEGYLPLTAGEEYKLTGPLGLTHEIGYGNTLPAEGFEGQLFFLEAESTIKGLPSGGEIGQTLIKNSLNDGDVRWGTVNTLPIGGEPGQALIKNSSTDGDVSWKDIVALPKGGAAGQVLVKNDATDGNASWQSNISGNAATATKLQTARTIGLTGDVSGSGSFDGNGDLTITTTVADNSHNHNNYLPLAGGTMTGNIVSNSKYLYTGSGAIIDSLTPSDYAQGCVVDVGLSGSGIYRGNGDGASKGPSGLSNLIIKSWYGVGFATSCYDIANPGISVAIDTRSGDINTIGKIYGAVYNDYAEYRNQKEDIKPGYCVASADNGQVYKTTEKFQACDGIISDTFGFAIGETDECKTPLAVAGRVLAYCEGNRYDYHSGDTVCAGPEGKVCKMTREEIREWPDRIVGIVSEIPEYDTWGSENAKVDGRIWIKIK